MVFKTLTRLAACLGLAVAMGAAHAATYPSAPVHIVVGFAAGGGTDVMGRIMAQDLSTRLNGSFVVFNKPGAGAMVGAEFVAKAAPDGNTLLLGTSAEMTISPPLYGHAPYDPAKDFVPVAYLGASPAILLANTGFADKTLADIIADAKANPGKLTMATGGTGTAPDLAAHQLKLVAGIDFVIAPYKGAGPSQADAVAGHVPLVFSTIASALPLINGKQLRPIAVIQEQRSALVPEVPSTAEQGLKDYAAVTWFGLFAPAGTSPEILATLRGAIATILADPDTKTKFATLGIEPAAAGVTPEALTAKITTELAHWGNVIKQADIKMQ